MRSYHQSNFRPQLMALKNRYSITSPEEISLKSEEMRRLRAGIPMKKEYEEFWLQEFD